MTQSDYNVNINLLAKDQLSGPASNAAKGLAKLGDAAKAASSDIASLKSAASNIRLAESLAAPSDLARAALDRLDKSLASGEIDMKQYGDAAKGIQHSFGLVTPATEKAAQKLTELDRAFAKGEISADDYQRELKEVAQSLDKVEEQGTKTGGAFKSIMQGMGQAIGMMAVNVARQLPQATVELVKVGATAERQANALDNLAAAAGTTGDEIVKSIQQASNFTIDRMTAMSAANRALVMDVATTPEAFEKLTSVATALGRAMGQDAAKSIDDFVTAAGRQSKLIADNLGLVVNAEDAYQRYADANNISVDAMDDAAKKQAFLNEMLRQGELKMRDLGDQTLDNAGRIEQASAAWKDAKTSLGLVVATIVSSTGALEDFSTSMGTVTSRIDELAATGPTWEQIRSAMWESFKTGEDGIEVLRRLQEQYNHTSGEIERYGYTLETSSEIERYAYTQRADAAEESAGAVEESAAQEADALRETQDELDRLRFQSYQAQRAQEDLASTTPPVVSGLEEETEAAKAAKDELLKLNEVTLQVAESHLSTASSYTSYYQDVEESAQDLAAKREQIEADHAEKMAKIAQQGQARAVKFDEDAQRERIKRMQEDLTVLLQSQAEQTDKTNESTRMRMQLRIERAQEGLAEEERLLDDYLNGRLVKEGANVNALIQEENRRYAESIANLEAAQLEQEAAQKESLGRMVLQHFNAWAEMNLATDGFTDQEVEYITATRLQISEQYGLVTDTAIAEMEAQEAEWKRTMAVMTGDAKNFFDFFVQQFNAMEDEKVIRIRTELSERPTDVGGGIPRQHGGPVRAGEAYLVGERGPELFVPGRQGQIVNNSQAFDSHDTYMFNTPHAPTAVLESQRRQRRQASGRIM